jgi:hypothetical protein
VWVPLEEGPALNADNAQVIAFVVFLILALFIVARMRPPRP